MSRLLTLFTLLAPNDRRLWGIPGVLVSHVYFVAYAAIAVGAVTGNPAIAGVAIALSAVVEVSDILPPSRRDRVLTTWRRGLDIRMSWRNPGFLVALAAAGSETTLIGLFAGLMLAAALSVRVLRSDRFGLYAEHRVRPLGSMRAGVDRLARARRIERWRMLSELWIQGSVMASAAILGLAAQDAIGHDPAMVASGAIALAALTWAGGMALASRAMRPAMLVQHDEEVLAEFLALEPEVLCYFNGHPGSTYGVDVWLRTFEASDRRIALVYRHRSVDAVDTERLPAIVVREDATIERIVGPATGVALYPANGTLNVHLQRDKRLVHVFIGHGDSDKAGSASPFTQAYDQVWVAGQAGIDRYTAKGVAIPADRFVEIGRPPLSPVVRAEATAHRAAIDRGHGATPALERLEEDLRRHDTGEPPVTILYAPTWEGYFDDSDYSSIGVMGLDLVQAILEHLPGVRVVFKPHPLTGHRIQELGEACDEIRRALARAPGHHPSTEDHPGVDLYEWFDRADLLVADVSSVVTDFMAWDRPYAVTNPRRMPIESFTAAFPTTEAAYVLDPGARSGVNALRSALEHDPLKEKRLERRRYFMGDPGVDPLDRFNAAIDAAYASARPPA